MFAILGDIEFDMLNSPDTLDGTFGSEYAELSRIGVKPGLQFTGDKADEYRISILFHQLYGNPVLRYQAINEARLRHQAMAFVLGNGDYKGWYVITDLSAGMQMMDVDGTLQALQLEMTLREFTGTPANPLKPPALKSQLPGLSALTKPEQPVTGVAGMIRSAVGYARQAQSALQTASQIVRVARQVKTNPVAAFTRIPGIMTSLGDVTGSLSKSIPALQGLTNVLPEAASVARTAGSVVSTVDKAYQSVKLLNLSNPANLGGTLDSVGSVIGSATSSLDSVSPQLSKMASRIITRSM